MYMELKLSTSFLLLVEKGLIKGASLSISPPAGVTGEAEIQNYDQSGFYMTRSQINDTVLFQSRVKVKVVGEVSEK